MLPILQLIITIIIMIADSELKQPNRMLSYRLKPRLYLNNFLT